MLALPEDDAVVEQGCWVLLQLCVGRGEIRLFEELGALQTDHVLRLVESRARWFGAKDRAFAALFSQARLADGCYGIISSFRNSGVIVGETACLFAIIFKLGRFLGLSED